MGSKRRDTEAVISGAGVFLSLITLLVEKVKEIGGTVEDIYRLVTPEGAEKIKRIASIIVGAGEKIFSLAQMIALGMYDRVNLDITAENFPVDSTARWDDETRVFHFDKRMSTDAVRAEMDKEGWKPACIWHLLFVGMKNPEWQRQFPIYALGSVWRRLAPCLYGSDGERVLGLGGVGDDWLGGCRFLAVRK